MRLHLPAVFAALFVAACAAAPPVAGPAVATAGRQQAVFPEFPANLLFAAAEACDAPTQTVVRPTRNEVRCETLPAPDAAAAIILTYDGTVQDLPRFVIGFRAERRDEGFLVTAENYIRVPQRTGPALQVRLQDPMIDAGLRELLIAAGGAPVAAPAEGR